MNSCRGVFAHRLNHPRILHPRRDDFVVDHFIAGGLERGPRLAQGLGRRRTIAKRHPDTASRTIRVFRIWIPIVRVKVTAFPIIGVVESAPKSVPLFSGGSRCDNRVR